MKLVALGIVAVLAGAGCALETGAPGGEPAEVGVGEGATHTASARIRAATTPQSVPSGNPSPTPNPEPSPWLPVGPTSGVAVAGEPAPGAVAGQEVNPEERASDDTAPEGNVTGETDSTGTVTPGEPGHFLNRWNPRGEGL